MLTPEQRDAIQSVLDTQRDLEDGINSARLAVQGMVDHHELIPVGDIMAVIVHMRTAARTTAQEIVDLHPA